MPSSTLGTKKCDLDRVGSERFTKIDWLNLSLIVTLSAAVLSLRWLKMESLYNIDPSMWLSQVGRFASGQLPYRDFSWNYPPMAIFLLGAVARAFGPTFAVMQTTMDVLSLSIVLLAYGVIRYFLPSSLHFASIAALVAICSTALTKFNLFSFSTYSPSLQIAAIGLLLILLGGVRQLQRASGARTAFGLMASGAFLSAASKPEAMLAAFGSLTLLAVLDWKRNFREETMRGWARYYAALFAAAVLPTLAVYAAVALLVGWEPLKLGVSGYGLATFACPWWPTGLGVFGAAAATGEAAFVAAVLLWPFRRNLKPECRVFARVLWAGAVPGFLVFAGYVWLLIQDTLRSNATAASKLMEVSRAVVWTSPILLPVMWASIWICAYLVANFRRLNLPAMRMCFFLSVPVIMSVRSLFGTTLFPYTEVSAMCYPFFILAAPCLMWTLLGFVRTNSRAPRMLPIGIALGSYSLLRLVAAYPAQFANGPYYSLSTNAGIVRLSDGGVSTEIYRYVVEHTAPSDSVLDFPYGGGFNFASGRPSPVFTTQFQQLRMPLDYQNRDLQQFLGKRPKIVIADNEIHYGASFGYKANMNCTFPRFQWAPTEPSWDPTYVFPLVRFIERNYIAARQIGHKLILIPN